MKIILDRALTALKIILDIIWISLMVGVAITMAGIITAVICRVFTWAYNLLPL
jgi:hypothetical protein